MLFKGWQRLLHDLISREGPFLETACVPIAGLAILLWPLVVVGSILLAIVSSIFIGLYGSVIVYQVPTCCYVACYMQMNSNSNASSTGEILPKGSCFCDRNDCRV